VLLKTAFGVRFIWCSDRLSSVFSRPY